MRNRILQPEFFRRSTLEVARELLGKFLVLENNGHRMSIKITEVEAYDGSEDLASHASRGKTKRNEPMFEAGGVWYIYLCYGMYHMLNIVTGEKDYPAAILIRGIDGLNGPGKLTKYLKIDKSFNNKLASKKNKLYIEDRGIIKHSVSIKCLPRIGVDYAGPVWSKKKWRFRIDEPS